MRKKAVDEIIASWRKECVKYGMPNETVGPYLDYVANLIKQDLPPIVDMRHLSMLIGIDYNFMTMAVNAPNLFYRQFNIPKRTGGVRSITAPYPSLKYIQTWIYDKILKNRKTHFCVHGFVRGRSILSNASVHSKCKMLLKMDISDFFGSIPRNYVINYFHKELGYNLNVSWILSSLCCLDGSLPQGAPTSPALSNLISLSFDRRLYRLSKKFGLEYTRYADDIAFSGDNIPDAFIRYVEGIAKDCGYEINKEKTHLYAAGGSKIIAGVSLATGEPRIPRDYRRKLRQELHYVDKYGLTGHMRHNKIRRANYPESILGKVSYWLSIEPDNEYAKQMYSKLQKSMEHEQMSRNL